MKKHFWSGSFENHFPWQQQSDRYPLSIESNVNTFFNIICIISVIAFNKSYKDNVT